MPGSPSGADVGNEMQSEFDVVLSGCRSVRPRYNRCATRWNSNYDGDSLRWPQFRHPLLFSIWGPVLLSLPVLTARLGELQRCPDMYMPKFVLCR